VPFALHEPIVLSGRYANIRSHMSSSEFDWDAIRAHYEAGCSRTECQAKFGFSDGAWERAVGRGDIVPRPRSVANRASTRRAQVGKLRAQGLSYRQISDRLGIGKPTVAYHARRLGIPVDESAARRYDWAAIQEAYDSGLSMRQCATHFGFCSATWASAVKRGAVTPRAQAMPIEELLVVGRRQTGRGHLKRRLINAGLKDELCESCGISEWNGKPLSLELHHVNGDGHDNRLENLELLCANCHSQTETWGGRNGHRRRRGQATLGAGGTDL
jgi:hypothetical protein